MTAAAKEMGVSPILLRAHAYGFCAVAAVSLYPYFLPQQVSAFTLLTLTVTIYILQNYFIVLVRATIHDIHNIDLQTL